MLHVPHQALTVLPVPLVLAPVCVRRTAYGLWALGSASVRAAFNTPVGMWKCENMEHYTKQEVGQPVRLTFQCKTASCFAQLHRSLHRVQGTSLKAPTLPRAHRAPLFTHSSSTRSPKAVTGSDGH